MHIYTIDDIKYYLSRFPIENYKCIFFLISEKKSTY